ncbi:TonB-dependent receptor [Chryseobacterium koreense]|uniref:TonB-dependent receptor n=1 Tax=Chryseobacterium koreense TaxID=232216 RepID=UPI0026F13CB5|nr:TonB-dependent receptor [Chryseobacterium koreense]
MRNTLLGLVFLLVGQSFFAQIMGTINGVVKDKNTEEILVGATLSFTGNSTIKTVSDENGNFSVQLPVGKYHLETSHIGYTPFILYNINLSSGNAQILEIEMEPKSQELQEVVINTEKSVRAADMVTPLATQKLTAEEIKVNPGGNFDVSKVIQVLPGVAGGTTPNRNDIIVRGGGPSENVYYLDGIEIPVLNHFQTQGASGGATGILNVSFIQDVQLTSSAFNAKYDNALASTIVIKQRNGNPNHLSGNLRLSGTEFAAMLEGPLGKNTTFMASARRSYLQFLFKLLDLPIRPDYHDFQYKVNHKINSKTELTFIGIGAIDHFELAVPKKSDANTAYTVRANPLIDQWNYTVGATLKRLVNDGYFTVALSRNMFFNGADRYENNASKSGHLLYSLGSHETENKLRFDMNKFTDGWKYSYGLDAQYAKYDADIFNNIKEEAKDNDGNTTSPAITFSSNTAIDFFKLGAYGQVAKYFFDDKFLVSGGIRADLNTYTKSGLDLLRTISPRASFSYIFNNEWNISASVGSYYKLPVYTMLGYKDRNGNLANKDLEYINSIHYTLGTEFVPRNDLRFTLEAFYKDYRNYPVSLTSGISFANIGTDYSAVGSDTYTSAGRGRVYGIEAYGQQKLLNRLFYVASATIYKSEFSGADHQFRSSTWDYGFIASATLGYQLKKNWDIGLKYRIAGGQPYTPFDMAASTATYLATGTGVYDYAQLNNKRLPVFSQLDLRVDKKFNFKKVSLDIFADFQNILFYKTPYLPKFTFERTADNSGFMTTDGQPVKSDGSNAIPLLLDQKSATIVPSIGFIFEF